MRQGFLICPDAFGVYCSRLAQWGDRHMRSTKASAAVARLRTRSQNAEYSMSMRADGLFVLRLAADDGTSTPVGEALPIDEFVRFVNGIKAEAPKRESALDLAFRTQLKRK